MASNESNKTLKKAAGWALLAVLVPGLLIIPGGPFILVALLAAGAKDNKQA